MKNNKINNHIGVRDAMWAAYIFKLVLSLQRTPGDTVAFGQAYNARSLLGLNKYYFGNATMFPICLVEKNQFEKMTVESIALNILEFRNSLVKKTESLYKNIAFWERLKLEGKTKNYMYESVRWYMNGGIQVNNLTTQPIYDIDFGSGPPIWFEIPNRRAVRHVYALPSPEKNGDVILFVSLPESEMIEFSKCFTDV